MVETNKKKLPKPNQLENILVKLDYIVTCIPPSTSSFTLLFYIKFPFDLTINGLTKMGLNRKS